MGLGCEAEQERIHRLNMILHTTSVVNILFAFITQVDKYFATSQSLKAYIVHLVVLSQRQCYPHRSNEMKYHDDSVRDTSGTW